MRILVFHADHSLRWALEELLREDGHTVFSATSFESARAQLDIGAFDTLVTDANDQPAVMRLLRSLGSRDTKLRVVVLCSRSDSLRALEALWPVIRVEDGRTLLDVLPPNGAPFPADSGP